MILINTNVNRTYFAFATESDRVTAVGEVVTQIDSPIQLGLRVGSAYFLKDCTLLIQPTVQQPA